MYKKKILIFVLLLVICVMFFIITKQRMEGTMTNVLQSVQNVKKSDFIFKTIENKIIKVNVADKIVKIEGRENKLVFLKVFGWDCNFCQKEIPELIKLKKKLGDSFEVIAIEAQGHTLEESKKYVKQLGINYHIVTGEKQNAFYSYLQNKYGWNGVIPLTIVISKKGKVLAFELGAKSYSLSELIKASLLRE